jgi:hypothetical protein
MKHKMRINDLVWLKLHWARPFEPESVTALITHLASHSPSIPFIYEVRGYQRQISYYIGADRNFMRIITELMNAHGDIRFSGAPPRLPVNVAEELAIAKTTLTLNTGNIADVTTRAGLAALLRPSGSDQSVLQIVFGPPYNPALIPPIVRDPHASLLKRAFGTVPEVTNEAKKSIQEKIGVHGFHVAIRMGATGDPVRAKVHIASLLSALRTVNGAGVELRSLPDDPGSLNAALLPRSFPLRLSVEELNRFMLLPAGEVEIVGVPGLHPRQIPPPTWYRTPHPANARVFAVSPDRQQRFSISPEDSKLHTHIMGPTGVGKSTVLQHMILSDIYAGRGCLVIDPKADLNNSLMGQIPKYRESDVVEINAASLCPTGFNPLAHKDHPNPILIVDAIYNVFYGLFKENFGIRTQDVLTAALLTLVHAKGSSLLWLPALLTDENFRKKITAGINDKIGLEPYWAGFEAMNAAERRQEVAPVLNKVRQFILRPGLRNILGQSQPKFDLNDLFTKNRIVLVSLNKGLMGAESARLLGSLFVGQAWTLALGRAGIPEAKRNLVSFYIDELQDYISSIGSDFSDALAQARGLGVGICMAHQFREQLPPEIRAGVDANARNKIMFKLEAADAKAMKTMAPELEPEDFMALPRYHIYSSFNSGGRNTGWVSGMTLPISKPICNATELRKKVEVRYGKPAAETEKEYLDLMASCRAEIEPVIDPEIAAKQFGRRKKE